MIRWTSASTRATVICMLPSSVASASPSAAVAAPPTVACRDVPIPDSNKPEAVASYRAGMQAWCDANQALAENDLQRAVDLDPTLAAAHLRLSRELFDDGDTEAARRELETAQQLRVSLSPRDLDVLAFYEPIIMHSPPNWDESRRRRDAAVVRSPEMAELWALRAAADLSLHEFGRARADATRAATLDPSCAMARLILAQAEGGEGKLDAEKAALDECLQVAPNAGSCLYTRAMLRARQGDCVGFGSDGEALVAASPNDWRGRDVGAGAPGSSREHELHAALQRGQGSDQSAPRVRAAPRGGQSRERAARAE